MIHLENLQHAYAPGVSLRLPDFALQPGEQALVVGPSGSGKTTLLHLVAGLLAPQQGRVMVAGQDLALLSGKTMDRFRGQHIGFVPQRLHLVGALAALENLLLAQYLAAKPQRPDHCRDLLGQLGLQDKEKSRPHQLSQGQAQRLAIARALVNSPAVVLADEPTASLDDANAGAVCHLLQSQARALGATLLIATHDARLKNRFDRHLDLSEVSA